MDAETTNWIVFSYIAMPFISGIVGWGTNLIAIKMMFYPYEFWGKPPFLGWQGIIPSKIARMASITVDLMTTKLISIEEVFSRLDPKRVAEEMEDSLEAMLEPMVFEILSQYSPRLWTSLPDSLKTYVFNQSRADRPKVVADIMSDIKSNITNLFDLKKMVIDYLVEHKEVMNAIFLNCGKKEFKFIEMSGLYLGFLFGLGQMFVWYFYKTWWLLPVAGLIVGYATNWLALKMIFKPIEPQDFGPFTIHGLFLMRQREVAEEYGKLIAKQIITPRNIIEAILHGPMTDNFFNIVQKHTKAAIDQHVGISKPVFQTFIGPDQYKEMKERICEGIMENLPDTMDALEEYAEEALDIKNTLTEKLAGLSAEDYVGILRPAFQQDEWKLVLAGAILGLLVGFFQLVFMFGGV